MDNILWTIIVGVLSFFIGFIFAKIFYKKHYDGAILIENGEEDRELMRWVLDMELDEIKEKKIIVFKVEDQTSKK